VNNGPGREMMGAEAASESVSRPSVLIVSNFLGGARGTHPISADLSNRLREQGWRVWTTSPQWGKLRRLLDMVWTIWFRRNQYHVAHVDVFSGPAFRWAEVSALALTLLRRPYSLTLHGGRLPKFSDTRSTRVSRLFGSAEIISVPSGYLLEAMAAYSDRLRLLPNPLALEDYPYRKRAHLAPRLIWLRAFHPIYDPVAAVRVLHRLVPDFPQVALTMVGPDKGFGALEAVKEEARQLGVSDRLEIRGWLDKSEIGELLSEFDVFINTTKVDNTPVTVMEALASGLCVVSTNVGGLPHLLEDGSEGLLVPPEDPDAMAQAVARLLREPELASQLSVAGRRRAEEWSWRRLLPRWEDLLSSVATRNIRLGSHSRRA